MRDARLYLEKIPTRMLDEDIIEQIQQAQEDAYNQAIQDVEVNIECCMNLSEGFEYPTVKWDSISKLKIK